VTPPVSRWTRLRAALASARQAIGLDDLVFVLALALLSLGVGMVWIPGGLIVPGAVLLWLVLPSRAPFVTRPPVSKKPTAPDAPTSRRSA